MRILTRFMLAASDVAHFPVPQLPEIAFLGRSNVGKSSVINSLLGHKVARTSSTPGRTRSINFFEVRWPGKPRPELVFTDLPGYGYAKVSREISQGWPKFIEPYLRDRPNLTLCLALIDANVPPPASDRQMVDYLKTTSRPFLIVATKTDRMSSNELQRAMRGLGAEYAGAKIMPYSAKSGAGRDDLWREIRMAAESRVFSR